MRGAFSVRYWSILFALAAIFSVGAFLYAPFSPDWWLPNPAERSSPRRLDLRPGNRQPVPDHPLVITGVVFIGTQVVLVWVATATSTRRTTRASRCGRPSTSTAASGWR